MRTVSIRGHFGEYVQGRLGPNGALGLITVPCSRTGLQAELRCGSRHVDDPLAGFLQTLGLAGQG